jgi:hypothetical protein
MSTDLEKKAGNTKQISKPDENTYLQANNREDGGYLSFTACVGSFIILCSGSDPDMKILGGIIAVPSLLFMGYDAYRNYIKKDSII